MKYTAQPGDCVSSIAKTHGLFWKTVLDHADNSKLKQLRKDPNVLLPGDQVEVPDLRKRSESSACESRHRFRLRGVPAKLRFQIMHNGKPYKDTPCSIEIDGKTTKVKTDAEGNIEIPIPPEARRARLIVEKGNRVFDLHLGGLDPVEEVSGVQARLTNLGFDAGPADGDWGKRSARALRAFQRANGLEEKDDPDDATRDKLKEVHGS